MPVPVNIVLPCYNPGDKWPAELENFYNFSKNDYHVSFIVVNDGTKGDKVHRQVELLRGKGIPVRIISYPVNQGKGYALRTGVKEADGDLVVYTDIDFPFTDQSTLNLITMLAGGNCDVVAGYRNEAYYKNKMSGFRIALSKAFRYFIKRGLKISVTDTQCGLKGFNKKGKEKFLATTINRYLFDFEFIYAACRDKSVRTGTVEVQLKEGVVFSKMRPRVLIQETVNLLSVLFFKKG